MFRTSTLVAAVLSITSASLEAASTPVVSARKESDGILLRMNPGAMKLQVCTDKIIRVTYAPTDVLPTNGSFVVVAKWVKPKFKMKEEESSVILQTKSLSVHVDRKTGALMFLDADGRVLLAESPDGKQMIPTHVNSEDTYHAGQTFLSPPDEALFGLGQFQDGLWNWRGIPRHLRQVNTQTVLPMLISSRGYGLLWDNASLTDFNPPETEIPLHNAGTNDSHTGTFTTGTAGDYVFYAKTGTQFYDVRDHFILSVNDEVVARVTNYWVASFVAARVNLRASQTCNIGLSGGGSNATVFAGPFSPTTTFSSQVGDAIDYYFFYGPELDDVIAGYRQATGQAPMFPKWALGYWQCRERYTSQQHILETAEEFRRRNIPADVIVQDWKYWGKYGWGAFQFDEEFYPDPEEMIQQLHDMNFHFVISTWSKNSGDVNRELKAAGGLLPRGKAGQEWVDAYNPAAGAIRWKHMKKNLFDIGVDGWWQDATEPETQLLENFQIQLGSVNRVVSAYPLFANQSVYEGQRAAGSDKRVCILSRSAYAGQQRYATACWSGDVPGTWESFRRQIPAGLNFSMAGMPYWTTDIGGFFRPEDQMESAVFQELLVRWFEFGAFCPVFRIHGNKTETEMWKWPAPVEKIMHYYDDLRYRLMPYLYSTAWQVTSAGSTMMRGLPMDFQSDAKALTVSDQFMFGPAFLVAPVTQPNATNRSVYLPSGTDWFDFWTGETLAGGQTLEAPAPLETIPLYVRAGGIIPLGPRIQYATEKPADPIELRVYPGADGAFTLYEDEGDNYNYENGTYATIPISWNEKSQKLTIGKRKGQFPGMLKQRIFRIVWVTANNGVANTLTEKAAVEVRYTGRAVHVVRPR